MLFSGSYEKRVCSGCGYTKFDVRTTSLLYWMLLLGVAISLVLPRVAEGHGGAWWIWPVAIAGEFVALGLTLAVVGRVACLLRGPRSRCRKCRSELRTEAEGFYDFRSIPTCDDVSVGIVFVLVQVAVLLFV